MSRVGNPVPLLKSDLTSTDFAAFAVLIILTWELAKKIWAYISGSDDSGKAGGATEEGLAEQVPSEFKDLPVPEHPHMECAIDPPSGLHYSNPKKPFSYECDCTYGTYLYFHPPTGASTATGPNGFDYAEYFQCKSRLWEMRIHMKFKRVPAPDEELFFGIELEEYVPLSRATAKAQKMIVAGIRQAIGGVYHSAGDDPAKVPPGVEYERPVCVLPLWAFDQFMVTPAGQEPPDLADPNFSSLGSRRYKRIKNYAEEMSKLQRSFNVNDTYTFAFWGCSRFLDVLNWMVIGLPIVTPAGFNKFAGKPPVHVVMYSLTKPQAGEDTRHVKSRKHTYFRAAIWSSALRPSRERIEELTGKKHDMQDDVKVKKKKGTLNRRFQTFMLRMGSCTGGDRMTR